MVLVIFIESIVSHMYVASKILKSVLHNLKIILVNCHVVMSTLSTDPILLEKSGNWVNWKQQKIIKTVWPKFVFHRIYSFKVDDDSDKIWKFSETDYTHFFAPEVRQISGTDHTHFFAPKIRQISQNFSWKLFWSSITPHKKI